MGFYPVVTKLNRMSPLIVPDYLIYLKPDIPTAGAGMHNFTISLTAESAGTMTAGIGVEFR